MKIVHLTYLLTFGGIETMLVNIANEQVLFGHEVEIIVVEKRVVEPQLRKLLNPKIRLYQARRIPNTKDLLSVFRINWFLLKAHPDVIHIHASGLMRCILMPWMRKKTCCTLHALPFDKNTVSIKSVPKVFAISEVVHRELIERYGVDSTVVYNGIHPELIMVRKDKIVHKGLRIVVVSRLEHKKKGQDIIIHALYELKRRGLTDISVDFIGDGESKCFLEKESRDFGVEKQVLFLGSRPQEYIFEHLADYDLFVQPSRYDGFALTVAEAMAAKVPVLVASGQGPEEVIDHGHCGYIFKNGDVVDCADKIAQLLRNGIDAATTEKAYERVWKLYNVNVTAKSYLDNYLQRNNL